MANPRRRTVGAKNTPQHPAALGTQKCQVFTEGRGTLLIGRNRTMGTAVKKTVCLSPELAKEAEDMARAQDKTLSAVIQDVLRAARLKAELRNIQGHWRRKAKEKGVLIDKDLEHYLDKCGRCSIPISLSPPWRGRAGRLRARCSVSWRGALSLRSQGR